MPVPHRHCPRPRRGARARAGGPPRHGEARQGDAGEVLREPSRQLHPQRHRRGQQHRRHVRLRATDSSGRRSTPPPPPPPPQPPLLAAALSLVLFAAITFYTCGLLADCYRVGDPVTGKRNYTYTEAVQSYLGGWHVWFYGFCQYVMMFGTGISSALCLSCRHNTSLI